MKEIKLINNKGITFVDDNDYYYLNQYKWRLNKGYSITSIKINNKWTIKKMHRLIMNEPKDMHIDHIDHNGLNNQKDNLRIVTRSQNQMNRKNFKNSLSKYKGVSWHKSHKKWQVRITVNNNHKHLGYFKNERDAAIVYNNKAKELFKEYAYLNEV